MNVMTNPRWRVMAAALMMLPAYGCAAGASPRALQPSPTKLPVMVRVDFGPAGKPAREKSFEVDQGTTAKDAVSLLLPIQSAAVCCNTRELAAIDGVWADASQNRWWTCRINGSGKIGPFRTELKAGDLVEWKYIEEPQ